MIYLSVLVILFAFGLSFLILRKKGVVARIAGGMILSALFVALFITLLIIGGDPALPGSIPYDPNHDGPQNQSIEEQPIQPPRD